MVKPPNSKMEWDSKVIDRRAATVGRSTVGLLNAGDKRGDNGTGSGDPSPSGSESEDDSVFDHSSDEESVETENGGEATHEPSIAERRSSWYKASGILPLPKFKRKKPRKWTNASQRRSEEGLEMAEKERSSGGKGLRRSLGDFLEDNSAIQLSSSDVAI